MKSYLQHIPLGSSLPINNPHAISVSFPTMADVIGYEQKDQKIIQELQSGYPRFFRNKLVHLLCETVRKRLQLPQSIELFPLPCGSTISLLNLYFDKGFETIDFYGVTFILLDVNDSQIDLVRGFLRHAGLFLSSRNAEEILLRNEIIPSVFEEKRAQEENPSHSIQQNLQKAYGANSEADVFLSNCGMNAFFSVFQSLKEIGKLQGKTTSLQLGNLYLDSYDILRTYGENISLAHVVDFGEIKRIIDRHHTLLSAVYVEVPNNPLLECVDLPRLYEVCCSYGIPLVIDSSLASAHTMHLLPYCDVITESLSKFANGQGDLLMGAVLVNAQSKHCAEIKSRIDSFLIQPYVSDLQRIAFSLSDYAERVLSCSVSTKILIDYLEQSSAIEQVFSVLHPASKRNFELLQKDSAIIPSVFSVVFKEPLAYYYDKLALPKGPSFGTIFTLAMPYVYLAHYDLVQTETGNMQLREMGLHPELLRISVGVEPVDEIIAVLRQAGI
jgi:cystathionine gamma-synthase